MPDLDRSTASAKGPALSPEPAFCSAILVQWVGAAAAGAEAVAAGAAFGSGNGEPAAAGAGAAAAAAGFGFLCFGCVLRGGGPAGFSSANTGLGSSAVVAGVVKSPGVWVTVTGTVSGWYFGRLKVTEKFVSGVGTDTEHGVLQPGPSEVTASAPCGAESSWTCIGGGADLNESNEKEEQPARLSPATAIAMIRRMIPHSTAAISHNPRPDHRGAGTEAQQRGPCSLKDG